MSAHGTRKSAIRSVVGSAILVALVLTIPLLLGGHRAVQATFQDDALYYARIARNVARGEGLTFDGLHSTSGFHPLWLGLLVPLFVVFSGPMAPLFAAVCVQIVLVSGAAALMTATLLRVVDRRSALAGGIVVVAVPWTGASLTGGLEGALTLAVVTAGWWLWLDVATRPRAEPSAWLGPGIVLALAGLVNNRTYFDEVLRGQALAGYLKREGISWIADQSCGVNPTLEPYLARTGSLALARRTEWVASFYDRAAPDGCPGVAIWRLRLD